MDWKEAWKKTWHFLWKEDSLLSWIVSIILAFILIKLIIYPGLGLALGTNLPVVAVISESMEHDGSFDEWWQSTAICSEDLLNSSRCTQADWYAMKGITKEQFRNFPMHNGFNKGDIIILRGSGFESLQVGEIIVFQSGLNYPIIHRAIGKDDIIATKGDHNQAQIVTSKLNEKYITKDQLIGRAWIKVPYIGYIKIWFTNLVRCLTFNGCYFE